MKVKQNGKWKNLGGIDPTKLGKYTLLTPDMVSGNLGTYNQKYVGTATHLFIDDSYPSDNLENLFSSNNTIISLVILTDKFTNLGGLFASSGAQLKNIFIDTSNVTIMSGMFENSQATTLDLSSFDTSKVTGMAFMFNNSQATTLDLSSFDTSNVTHMGSMFENSQATTLDLSSFDTSNVTDTAFMFWGSQATVGYARTQADADRLNASSGKPAGLNFVVKP